MAGAEMMGGDALTDVEVAGGVSFKSDCVPAGGGLATDESITTIFPGPPRLSGSWVVGVFVRPAIPLEGNGGKGPLLDSWELSAIILWAGVNA